MSRLPKNNIDGILLVDKPQDWTSFDVLNMIRHRFSIGKIGHCGTLDPLATGLLVVLLGKGTKLQDQLMAADKIYEGTLRLGVETDSEDITGTITSEHDPSGITMNQVMKAAEELTGDILQIPPMVSAIKRQGKPLYELARKGITVEREPRPVHVFSFEFTETSSIPELGFRIHCSKGTYIRTLCADLGKKLGCGAIMTSLRRTKSGEKSVEGAVTVPEIKTWDLPMLQAALSPLPLLSPSSPDGK